jgi:hypothetical protein
MALIAHYKLDGNANDSVGGNHGTATNVTWVDGKLGQAGSFNGSNGHIPIPRIEKFTPRGSFSFSCWVNPANVTTGNQYIFLSGRDMNNSGFRIVKSSGSVSFSIFIDGISRGISASISNSVWSLVTCVYA